VSRDCPIFGVPPVISGTGKAMNFKFGGYIHNIHANKSPLKIWEKRQRGRIQGLPKFFEYPRLSQELVKLRTSNFVRTFFSIDRNKTPLQISGKVAVASQDSRNFSGHPYIGRIARSSLQQLSFLLSCSLTALRSFVERRACQTLND